jgi:hypothetical protein
MNSYDGFIIFIFFSKVMFVLCGVLHYLLVKENKGYSNLATNLAFYKEYFEFIFVTSMAILCIYLFNPIVELRPPINYETRVLLFVFGLIVFINSKWELFFEQSRWFSMLQYFIGGRRNLDKVIMNSHERAN